MVNFGLNAAAILGLFLAVAGAGLFFLRSIRPELARDYDIFFAAVGLLCGIILLFNGWRLDPILQFGQFLLTGTAVFFAFESIRMRSVATEQARRNTPIVDRDRPVSRTRVYTDAEIDRRIDPYDNVYEGAKPNYNSPRLRPYDDPEPRPESRSRRPDPRKRSASTVDYREEEPRRRPTRPTSDRDSYSPRKSPADSYSDRDVRRRRPQTPTNGYDEWSNRDEWADNSRSASRPRPRPSREDSYSEPTPSPTSRRRSNPADLGRSYEPEEDYSSNSYDSSGDNYDRGYDDRDLGRSYEDDEPSIPGDYVVDYQPVDDGEADYPDDDYDNYDDESDDVGGSDRYDDYDDRPEKRKPINFDRYE